LFSDENILKSLMTGQSDRWLGLSPASRRVQLCRVVDGQCHRHWDKTKHTLLQQQGITYPETIIPHGCAGLQLTEVVNTKCFAVFEKTFSSITVAIFHI